MAINQDLLQKVRASGTQLAETERQALLARAEYHTAIRRLHLAGASLREIAQALELSHQRVQQVVRDSGGSWWSRAWSTRRARRDAVCTWCGRPPSEVSKLVAGPNVYICDSCLEAAERAARGVAGTLHAARKGARERCAFCSGRQNEDRKVVAGPAANICTECLRICREFVDGRAA
jgi:hypothetical protein